MKWFIKALKQYVDFNGRARRKEFWYFWLFYFIGLFVAVFIGEFASIPEFASIFYALVVIPYLAVCIRRMHDTNHSGWFILVPIYTLVLLCTEGTKGENEYGSDPKEENNEITQ